MDNRKASMLEIPQSTNFAEISAKPSLEGAEQIPNDVREMVIASVWRAMVRILQPNSQV